jgi:hypothetical protein
MIRTLTNLQNAMISTIERATAAGVDTLDPIAAKEWYDADGMTGKLKYLWNVYHAAYEAAKIDGYVGVGLITAAEQAIINAQVGQITIAESA